MSREDGEAVARLILSDGADQQSMTRAFLESAMAIAPHLSTNGGPYRSPRGLGAWPLSFYGVGTGRLGEYRSTMMLEQDGTYSHFLINRDGEMEAETPHIGPGVDTDSTTLGPSFFVESVVGHDGADVFSVLRPASGPGAGEALIEVLTRSLLAISNQSLPPIFTWESQLRDA